MNVAKTLSWSYAEEFIVPQEAIVRAIERADGRGIPSPSSAVGSLLQILAAAIAARAVVEIGTGGGVGSLWLLAGMPEDGILTTIDPDAEHQRAAKEAFAAAGIRQARTRVISGRPSDVMPRLTDAAYDLVVITSDPANYATFVEEGIRMLRPGGLLVVESALWHDHVGDPANRDAITVTVREVGKALRSDDRVAISLLNVGDGVIVAIRQAGPRAVAQTVPNPGL